MINKLTSINDLNGIAGGMCQCLARYVLPNECNMWRPLYLGLVPSENGCKNTFDFMSSKLEQSKMEYLGCVNVDFPISIAFDGSGQVKI